MVCGVVVLSLFEAVNQPANGSELLTRYPSGGLGYCDPESALLEGSDFRPVLFLQLWQKVGYFCGLVIRTLLDRKALLGYSGVGA